MKLTQAQIKALEKLDAHSTKHKEGWIYGLAWASGIHATTLGSLALRQLIDRNPDKPQFYRINEAGRAVLKRALQEQS